MGTVTKISWTDHTFNPWIGCAKVSAGCTNCYAEELMDNRYGRVRWGKGQPRDRTSPANWKLPIRWDNDARIGGPSRVLVFCASLADWLDDEADANWLGDLLELIDKTPNLTWQLLTKRPENWESRLAIVQGISHEKHNRAAAIAAKWLKGTPPQNIWIGASAEDQKNYDLRAPRLTRIPARIRFISAEPLLGPIRFGPMVGIHWVIFGGESGAKARSCDVEWITKGLLECREAGVAPFVKQLGTLPVHSGFRVAGIKHKKGEEPSEWPKHLRLREFPR